MRTQAPKGGVTITEAIERTGFTLWQLRGMCRRNEIRHRRIGRYVYLHPQDVAALEGSTAWEGNAVEKEQGR